MHDYCFYKLDKLFLSSSHMKFCNFHLSAGTERATLTYEYIWTTESRGGAREGQQEGKTQPPNYRTLAGDAFLLAFDDLLSRRPDQRLGLPMREGNCWAKRIIAPTSVQFSGDRTYYRRRALRPIRSLQCPLCILVSHLCCQRLPPPEFRWEYPVGARWKAQLVNFESLFRPARTTVGRASMPQEIKSYLYVTMIFTNFLEILWSIALSR